MIFSYRKASVLLMTVLLVAFIIPAAAAANVEKTYSVQSSSRPASHRYDIINQQSTFLSWLHPNQELYVSIPFSLVNYYGNLTHAVSGDGDYPKFVTPEAVAPIAGCIQKVTGNKPYSNELFADAVLGLVHQIPYVVMAPAYPVETLVNNRADCTGLSILAASIMEAGGLDVILIDYTDVSTPHMNVGVYLNYTPVYHTPLLTPTSFTYDNKTYWTAETTSEGNWKVGDQSSTLVKAKEIFIPLSKALQSSPLPRVSASLNTNLLQSSITVTAGQQATSILANGVRALIISGSINPAISGQQVNVYISQNGTEAPDYLATVTDDHGNYSLAWNFTASDTYFVTASWNGASNYAGADSQTLPVFAGPQSFLEFETPGYNYVYVPIDLAAFTNVLMQGASDFLTTPLGASTSLSFSFILLQIGQTIANVPTTVITVPPSQVRVPAGNGRSVIIQVPAYNETVPLSVPNGLEAQRLPTNFDQTLDNQFCFVVQNDGLGNYSLEARGVSLNDLSDIQASTCVTNATGNIKDNTWYLITANITDNTVVEKLSSDNGTLIENCPMGNNQTVLLVTNNEDTAVVLENMTIQAQNNPTQQVQGTQKPASTVGGSSVAPYVIASILSAATLITVLIAVFYVRERKKITHDAASRILSS